MQKFCGQREAQIRKNDAENTSAASGKTKADEGAAKIPEEGDKNFRKRATKISGGERRKFRSGKTEDEKKKCCRCNVFLYVK